ncbi:hypothetical protein ABEB36_008793 [Hypothenemus hampei]|uniref:DUF4817 domain-containing protein n=1 Tax=Hypothenemus hampei TaxID=57062 RepID=A0ABD1EN34_HYPHA
MVFQDPKLFLLGRNEPVSSSRRKDAIDMLAAYFENMEYATLAARMHGIRYPEDRRSFIRLAHRFKTTGTISPPTYRRHRRCRTEENIINGLAYIEFNPFLNIRIIGRDLGLSWTIVQRILKE